MSARPLVSVVTGTWQRHDLLIEAIANVREQTYPNLEHVIVSDGPDPELYNLIASLRDDRESCPHEVYRDVPIRFAELGRNWTAFCPDSFAAGAFKTAQFLARGDYQMWLSDDERMLVPDYVERMVRTLEETGADFAYSKVRMWHADRPAQAWDMGDGRPSHGNITSAFYRSALLKHRMFELHVGSGTDWDQIAAWMAAGAKWAYIDETLFSHRIDK